MVRDILKFIELKKRTTHYEIIRYFGMTAGQLDQVIHLLKLKDWIECVPQQGCSGCPTSCHNQWVIVMKETSHV